MTRLTVARYSLTVILAVVLQLHTNAAEPTNTSLIGRWDITVHSKTGTYPSWLEVRKSGNATLVGSLVAQFGSARPISKVQFDGESFEFTVPPQWEPRAEDITYAGRLVDGTLVGSTTDEHGQKIEFHGVPAPSLKRKQPIQWGEPVELFNGKDLAGWEAMLADVPNGWIVRDGLLINDKPGNNIRTTETFGDFKLVAEFRYPAGSNSGIYLRGRYEAQIEDNYGNEPECHKIGGIYGFLTPAVNAAKKAGEWQKYEIELVGRTITVHLNGERVIDRQVIPGITGGAIDSHEGEPGPIYLQGDHGPVEFRRLTLTPGSES